MKKRLLTTVFAIAATLASITAQAAEGAYLTLTGRLQGAIKGSVTEKGKEGSIMVYAIDHSITSPRDPQSGLPTGKRVHNPLTVELQIDRATPELYQALVGNEALTDVTLKLWQPTTTGVEANTFTIKLTNANIASIKLVRAAPTGTGTNSVQSVAHIEVGFAYQHITWTWNDGGMTSGDDWSAH